ncbi:MAG TPA: hypothetical protein VMV05_05235 [bacterium]|nr:hypothetical protein [bacterium]
MRKLGLPVLTGLVLFLGLAPLAWSVPMFARMYSYNCSTCHYPGYGQLNKFGYFFRAAGYRIPKDIGKDMNDGKFDLANYVTARFSAGGSAKTTSNASGAPTADNGSFTLGGASLYLGGGIAKNYFSYSELGLGNGTGVFSGSAPSLSSVKMGFVTGSENDFFTVRVGKFGADGFAGSDRGPIGNASIASAVKPTGTGLELGYTHDDTRVTLAVWDGIQNPTTTGLVSTNGKAVTSTSIQAPTSDSNNSKDLQIFVNQFIGDDGLAINATYYNGYNAAVGATASSGGTGDSAGQEFYNAALFASSPIVKDLDIKAGIEAGQTNSGIFTTTGLASPTGGGFFGELDYSVAEITPIVFRWDYTTTDYNNQYADTQKFTLGSLIPLADWMNVYTNPTLALTRTDTGSAGYNDSYALSDSLFVFF